MESPRIVIIGSGNVATHLARTLDKVACVSQIISGRLANAECLARQLNNCKAATLATIDKEADFYIVAINDDKISCVTEEMPDVKGIVAHTSGSTPMQAIRANCGGIGVFYPLQTFSKDTDVSLREVPFFIEGDDNNVTAALTDLAGMLSDKVYYADSNQRATLHIAAVFACNFFNHLLLESGNLLETDGYPLDVLYPLLRVTLNKAMTIGPAKAQTGPAVRGDIKVIDKHLARLSGMPHDIYRLLSDAIMAQHTS